MRQVQATRREEGIGLETQVIETIAKIGPRNVSEISRITKAPVETIRYKIKRQFKSFGLKILAEPDYPKIGLTPFWGTLSFTPEHVGSATEILNGLSQIGYLVYYGKIVPRGCYSVLFAIPEGKSGEFRAFLSFAKEMGVLQDFTLVESLYSKHHSMKPRYFNFQARKWDVDWKRVALEKVSADEEKRSKAEVAVDNLDLLLVKELQIDPLQHVVAMARKLKIHPKTLEYHYRAHLEGLDLVPRYTVKWVNEIDSPPPHSLIVARLTLSGSNAQDSLRMRRITNKIPFLSSEDCLHDGTYVACMMIPLEETTATLDFIQSNVPDLSPRMAVEFIKQTDTSTYVVPHHLFTKGWSFEVEEAKTKFRRMITKLEKSKS